MSKLLSIIIFFVFIGTIASAQMRMNPADRAKQLGETLKLNSDQIKKVESVFTKQQDQFSKMMGGGDFRNEETRNKMSKLREESNNEIMKILTAKQKSEYKKILDEQKKRMEERRQNRDN
ncbi:MAG: hypothetical protein HY963_00515 [Ignavibacteriales bacterium]|jgi:Spy/CpxP family protein refolding chaperone|nr:hypothetical protein [Ignavibacteriales bacterium]